MRKCVDCIFCPGMAAFDKTKQFYQCLDCDKVFTQTDIEEHIKTSDNENNKD